MNHTVFQKGLVLIAVPLLFQLGFVLVIVRFQRERLAARTNEVIAQAHEIRTLVSDAGAGVRGYVVTRDRAFTAPLHSADRTESHWLGFEPAEVVGRGRLVEFVSPPSRDAYAATFARVEEHGRTSDGELELVRKDGSTFPVPLNPSTRAPCPHRRTPPDER